MKIQIEVPDDTTSIFIMASSDNWAYAQEYYDKEQLASMIVKDERSNNSGD
jgi:hypothetical protein